MVPAQLSKNNDCRDLRDDGSRGQAVDAQPQHLRRAALWLASSRVETAEDYFESKYGPPHRLPSRPEMTQQKDQDELDNREEFHSPVRRFHQLPEPVREFLEQLREDDINEIKEAIRFQRSAKVVGKFSKWLIISVATALVGAVAFGKAILDALSWIAPGGRP